MSRKRLKRNMRRRKKSKEEEGKKKIGRGSVEGRDKKKIEKEDYNRRRKRWV